MDDESRIRESIQRFHVANKRLSPGMGSQSLISVSCNALREDVMISGLQQSAIKALPYQYLCMAVFIALKGLPIADALDFVYEEWYHREEELERKIGGK